MSLNSDLLTYSHYILKIQDLKFVNIKFYKNIGMVEDGTRNFGGCINTVLKFDKEAMQTFLDKYQINLAF